MNNELHKADHKIVSSWINDGAHLGCGNRKYLLVKEKKVRAQGIEISEQAIGRCVAAGLSVSKKT